MAAPSLSDAETLLASLSAASGAAAFPTAYAYANAMLAERAKLSEASS